METPWCGSLAGVLRGKLIPVGNPSQGGGWIKQEAMCEIACLALATSRSYNARAQSTQGKPEDWKMIMNLENNID